MKNLIRIEYDKQTKELTMSERNYEFKEGEKYKVFPVSLTGNDLYEPKSFIFYYEYDNYANRFNEAKNYFYSLDVDFNNFNYLDLQRHSVKIYKS